MNNQYQPVRKFGSGDSFSDWAAIILSGLLFVRTMDLLSYFSPSILNVIVGGDVSFVFGALCAFWIEGVALTYHFNRRAQKHVPAQIVKWILISISGVCQIFDTRIIQGTLGSMPESQKLVFEIGVPLLPIIVLILIFFVGKLPDEDQYAPSISEVGIKNMLPDFKKLWNGTGAQYPVQTTQNQIVRQIEQTNQNQLPMPELRSDGNEVGNNANGNFQKGDQS